MCLSACTAVASKRCTTVDCMLAQEITRPLFQTCVKDLSIHDHLPPIRQRRINREYRYPATNLSTYHTLIKSGFMAPSPYDWCKAYAKSKATIQMPTAFTQASLRPPGNDPIQSRSAR
jgi:hypothetical protein